ncbi:MAG: bis(5'-nucleosyl)-tetraphosphatase (symmetrical) YqeK [Firmicutes bacterium]|nr:bis(5'-nucleosyl)-tetraphosphatase (symmetrical) YqeK [Bacillota bacterium]
MDYIDEYLKNNLKPSRLDHTYNVRDLAVKLADIYGADRDKAEKAALYHDMCKGKDFTDEKLNECVIRFGLDRKYLNKSALSHGKVAAKIMESELGITDRDILNAVSYHTTGRPGMSLLEKIIFVSDAGEPGRTYEGSDEIRETAFTDIDKACLMALEKTIAYVKSSGGDLDEDSVYTRDWFMKMEKERRENG